MTVEEQLRWEAVQRPRAGLLAIAAAALTLGGGIGAAAVFRDLPSNSPGIVLFFSERVASLVIVAVVLAAGAVCISLTLDFLYRAVRFRRKVMPAAGKFVALFGGIALAVAGLLQQGTIAIEAAGYADGELTYQAARNVLEAPPVVAAAIIRLAGQLALGLAFVLIGLNAMRAGLLTRFMGILGIIVGVLFVIPLGSPLPIVQAFWLVAFGVLLLGRWPGGEPPAWSSGKEEPWPSMQEMRERRQAELARQREERETGAPAPAAPEADVEEPVGAPANGRNGDVDVDEALGRPKRKRRKKRR